MTQVFRTYSGQYLAYDGLSGQIITIHDSLLKNVESKDIKETILSYLLGKGIIQPGGFRNVAWHRSYGDYRIEIEENIQELVLQLTRRCNLNCQYCVYSGNYAHMIPHSGENMSVDNICRSIDFYAAHSGRSAKASIAFYGGEPLLCQKEIQTAMDYARRVFRNKKLEFSVSTNGILLNRKAMEWLIKNPDIIATVTMNGPFQDKYRIDDTGRGSLACILKNFRLMKEEYPSVWDNQIQLIANISTEADIPELRSFYREKIGRNPVALTQIRPDMGNQIIQDIVASDIDEAPLIGKALRREYCEHSDSFLDVYFKAGISLIHGRELFKNNRTAYISSCMPLTTRLYVGAEGKFNICERVSDYLTLGDIKQGFDEEALRHIIEQVPVLVGQHCLNCWAQRLCLLCYQQMIGPAGKITDISEKWCEGMRQDILEKLKMYCEIAYSHPERLRDFAD